MVHQTIYRKLKQIIPNLDEVGESFKLKSSGFMDLNVDILYREKDSFTLALSHYYKHPSGDMIPDPDMEIRVFPVQKLAEALSYQDSFGYRRVYWEDNKVDLNAKKELNEFLNIWLNNLVLQGFAAQQKQK